MGLSPNAAAIMTSLCFGVMIFPWSIALKRLGQAEMFLAIGVTFMLVGAVMYLSASEHPRVTPGAAGIMAAAVVIYAAAIILMNVAMGHPTANLPIVAAIVAAYPIITAAIAFVVYGQRFSLLESLLFLMVVGGVVGLGLTGKAH